jgi:hypothetical protein
MDEILSETNVVKKQIYQEAAARSSDIKSPVIIEKDFWVCWALEQIFKIPEINSHITFKGGTSLSKCYNIINRFSEDCDLTLSKEFIGITEDAGALSQKGSNQRKKSLENLTTVTIDKINNVIKPLLTTTFEKILSNYEDNTWRIETDSEEKQNLLFYYPSVFAPEGKEYVQRIVKLEFGARGDSKPNEVKTICPYLYDILSLADTNPSISVNTLTATRTFWEKATLLHEQFHRDPNKPLKNRMFRHYYDIVMLHKYKISDEALKDLELLDIVIMNKKVYFQSTRANYETARVGTIRIAPNTETIGEIKKDYLKMTEMFFGEPPDFNEIIQKLKEIENTINSHGIQSEVNL